MRLFDSSLLNDPMKFLPHYLLPCNDEEARDYLEKRLETATLLWAFLHYFPEQFPLEWLDDQGKIIPGPHQAYSESEQRCMELISERLFPFSYELVIDVAAEEGRMSYIPLHGIGIDQWSDGLEAYGPGWVLLGLLNRDLTENMLVETQIEMEVWEVLKGAQRYSHATWSWEIFEQTCARAEKPLAYLPQAIAMLDHQTGNLFLDPTEEQPISDAIWCLEDIALLARQAQEAGVISEQAGKLAEWLASDPVPHLRKAVDLWNLALWNMMTV